MEKFYFAKTPFEPTITNNSYSFMKQVIKCFNSDGCVTFADGVLTIHNEFFYKNIFNLDLYPNDVDTVSKNLGYIYYSLMREDEKFSNMPVLANTEMLFSLCPERKIECKLYLLEEVDSQAFLEFLNGNELELRAL